MRYLFRNRALFSAAVIMCVSFLVGVVAGTFAAYHAETEIAVTGQISQTSFMAVAFNVLSYPLLALFFGLSVFGFVALPLLMAARGFVLVYAITAMTKSLGMIGIAYAFALFAVQCLIVLPCLLYIASHGFLTSGALASLASRMGKKVAVFSREYLFGMLIAFVFLFAAAAAEMIITPTLISFVYGFI